MNRSVFTAMGLALALALTTAGCGGSSTEAKDETPPATTTPSDSAAGPVLVSVARMKQVPDTLDLRRVTMQTSSDNVTITFDSYLTLDATMLTAPRCGRLGVRWSGPGRLGLGIPGDHDEIPSSELVTTYPGPHEVQITVSRADLGDSFSPTEPWSAYAIGPTCPPMNVSGETLPKTTPKAAP